MKGVKMMNCLKRLNSVFPDGITGSGIFTAINAIEPVPWAGDENISNLALDIEYFGNISGGKIVSPLIDRIVEGETISNSEIAKIANIIISMYYQKWGKLFDTLNFEYNPIENYDMLEVMTNDTTSIQYGKTVTRTDNLTHAKTGTETEVPNTTETRTDNLTHSKTGTETETPNTTETRTDNLTHSKTGTETEVPNTTETRTDNLIHSKTGNEATTYDTTDRETPNTVNATENKIFGFNSSVGVDSDSQSISLTGTDTKTKTGTETIGYNTQDSETGTQTLAKTGTDQKTYNTQDSETGTQTLAKTGTDQKTYNTQDAETGTQTLAKTGTDQTTYNTQDTQTGTQANAETGTDTHTRNYRLSRSGNIGVTTAQQMITQERDIWLWDFFHKVVFPDLDRVMTIPIY